MKTKKRMKYLSEEHRTHLKHAASLGGKAAGKRFGTPLDRFMANIVKDPITGCWNWIKRKSGGYGQFKVDGKQKYAHRFSFEHFNATKLPAGWQDDATRLNDVFVCHRCDNRSCVNPDHLFLGTHNENMKDGAEKARFKYGENHPSSRLKWIDIPEIHRRAQGGERLSRIAADYDVSEQTIYRIVNKQAWVKLAPES